jgi:hypothetical protein
VYVVCCLCSIAKPHVVLRMICFTLELLNFGLIVFYSTPGDKLSWRYRYNWYRRLDYRLGVRKRAEGIDTFRGISAECPSGSESRSPLLDACVLLQSEGGRGSNSL